MAMKTSPLAPKKRPIDAFLFEYNYMQRPWPVAGRAGASAVEDSDRSCEEVTDSANARPVAAKAISEPLPKQAGGRLPKALRR